MHRGYKPTGKFLVNLHESDKEAIKIGLTGTPLLDQNTTQEAYLEITFIDTFIILQYVTDIH